MQPQGLALPVLERQKERAPGQKWRAHLFAHEPLKFPALTLKLWAKNLQEIAFNPDSAHTHTHTMCTHAFNAVVINPAPATTPRSICGCGGYRVGVAAGAVVRIQREAAHKHQAMRP